MKAGRALAAALGGALLLAASLAGAQESDADPALRTGVLKAAVYRDFFPYSDAKEGGIDCDIAQALADKLGLKLSLLPFDAGDDLNDDLRNMVWKGHFLGYGPADVMLHVPIDPVLKRRNEKVAFFGAYQVESVMLAIDTRKIPDWQGFEVFDHESIAVDGGSFAAQLVLSMENGRYREHMVNSRRIEEAIAQMQGGKVAAVMGTRAELEAGGLGKAPYAIIDVSTPGAPKRAWIVGLAVKSERTELAARLADALKQLQDDGTMAGIFARHGVRQFQP